MKSPAVAGEADPEAARMTRIALFRDSGDILEVAIAGAHGPFPGIGRFVRQEDGDGFLFKPLAALK